MGSSQVASEASLFNNKLFPDLTICQSHKGVTKEYYCHKAILCSSSPWFTRALTGNFKEATSGVIGLKDDDAVYFELLLYYIYEHKWSATIAKRKTAKYANTFAKLTLTPICVYALADKYEVKGLKACAVDQMPSITAVNQSSYLLTITIMQAQEVIDAHYTQCVSGDCSMGRQICLYIIKWMPHISKATTMEALVKNHPAMGMDMYLAARENGGKLW